MTSSIMLLYTVTLLALLTYSPTTAQDCDRSACSNHGECTTATSSTSNVTSKCACDVYFDGDVCDVINLDTASYSVGKHGILFRWATPFNLTGYSVVIKLEDSDSEPTQTSVEVANDVEIEIDNLESDGTEYLLCIDSDKNIKDIDFTDPDITDQYFDSNKVNCGILETAYGGLGRYTVAAIGFGSAVCVILAVLFGCHAYQRCRGPKKSTSPVSRASSKADRNRLASNRSASHRVNQIHQGAPRV